MNEPAPTADTTADVTDIFQWANAIDAVKNELQVEFFLFSKGYTPYAVAVSDSLHASLKPLFLLDMMSQVELGAGTGLTVREYEKSEQEDNVLLRTELEKVHHADTLLHVIKHERHDIVQFSEQEHEMKRMKGIVAIFSHPTNPEINCAVVKQVSTANVLPGPISWQFKGGKFEPFQADLGWKIPTDSQVLIVGKDIFVFNQSKFERLFNYDIKKQLLADQKVAEIEKQYKLSYPEGLDLNMLVSDRKKAVNKLQKLEVGAVTQEQAISYADDMQLELMTDDKGAIIIMDGNDLDMFVNLINEDYITSELTGKRYEIKSKKLLEDPQGEPPRG